MHLRVRKVLLLHAKEDPLEPTEYLTHRHQERGNLTDHKKKQPKPIPASQFPLFPQSHVPLHAYAIYDIRDINTPLAAENPTNTQLQSHHRGTDGAKREATTHLVVAQVRGQLVGPRDAQQKVGDHHPARRGARR
eukprot:1173010-Pyramimonas_sp.AAC.1